MDAFTRPGSVYSVDVVADGFRPPSREPITIGIFMHWLYSVIHNITQVIQGDFLTMYTDFFVRKNGLNLDLIS